MDRVSRYSCLLLSAVVVMLITGSMAAQQPGPQIPQLTIITMSLPSATENAPYSATLRAASGTPPYTWSIVPSPLGGDLPAGLFLNPSTGVISGTPTGVGTSSFTVKVTDAHPNTATRLLSIVVRPPVTITTNSLPSGTQYVAYSATLTAGGGVTPYAWSLVSGNLPAGLLLNPSSGVISGTPTGVESSNFTVQVSDTNTGIATKALSITINAPLTITTNSLPPGTQNVAYSATLTASGGVTPYTWLLASGNLPAGLSLNPSTGSITGTPTTTGVSDFTISVTDTMLNSYSQPFSIIINSSDSPVGTLLWSDPNPSMIGRQLTLTAQVIGGGGSLPEVRLPSKIPATA